MVDITKCASDECDKSKRCYRHCATSSTWQAFADFLDMKDDGKACEFFVEMRRRNESKEAAENTRWHSHPTNLARAS